MKVLLTIRSDVERFPGGDYSQLLKTKEQLEARGVNCRIALGLEQPDEDFDLVHLFNTLRIQETYAQFSQAQAKSIPTVLSPIWHACSELKKLMAYRLRLPWMPIRLYCALKEAYYAKRSSLAISWPSVWSYRLQQRQVVETVDVILPNSNAELGFIKKELKARPKSAVIVPNGVNISPRSASEELKRDRVLCVGRIEPLKNQLGVLQAFRTLGRKDLRLIFYGAINSAHEAYWGKVKEKLEPGWIDYGGKLNEQELLEEYRKCRTVILASFFETTGLVVLEALANGATAVVLDNPYTREYFEEFASFCSPYVIESIVTALRQALSSPAKDVSSLLARYSWAEAGRITLEAYETVLRRRRQGINA